MDLSGTGEVASKAQENMQSIGEEEQYRERMEEGRKETVFIEWAVEFVQGIDFN